MRARASVAPPQLPSGRWPRTPRGPWTSPDHSRPRVGDDPGSATLESCDRDRGAWVGVRTQPRACSIDPWPGRRSHVVGHHPSPAVVTGYRAARSTSPVVVRAQPPSALPVSRCADRCRERGRLGVIMIDAPLRMGAAHRGRPDRTAPHPSIRKGPCSPNTAMDAAAPYLRTMTGGRMCPTTNARGRRCRRSRR